jgi:3-phosphoshikimate 1-carboxyvinyltransferase
VIIKIKPSNISGSVQAPASKSSMQRACALALITEGETIIHNRGNSNDDLAALDVIKKLGAIVKQSGNDLLISSKGVHRVSTEVNCGESGLGLRMFAPIAALSSQEIILNGSGSLLQRPMNFFDEIFPLLQIQIQSNNVTSSFRNDIPENP